jgi:uncharacterized protein (UPF0276 family)
MNDSTRTSASSGRGRSYNALLSAHILAGTSFKHEHLNAILAEQPHDGFFEVHAENYMGAGGPPHRALTALRENHPISVHGVCMSIGGREPLNVEHLARLQDLVTRYEPALVSEHLAWSSHGGRFYNDLLPLPYTRETLDRVCEHIDQVQERLQRRILLENPSTYVAFNASTMTEPDFIREIARRTGCGLLLDVNNVFVSATNHGFDASEYLIEFPLEEVGEIHLAGHTEQRDAGNDLLLIDSHDCAVPDIVWTLYKSIISLIGPIPTLVEWDSKLPDWPVLREQALMARRIMNEYVSAMQAEAVHAS